MTAYLPVLIPVSLLILFGLAVACSVGLTRRHRHHTTDALSRLGHGQIVSRRADVHLRALKSALQHASAEEQSVLRRQLLAIACADLSHHELAKLIKTSSRHHP